MSLFSDIAPSREICEEMARLGICQDEPELFYMNCQDDINKSWILVKGNPYVEHIIAPTLPRMMEELPDFLEVYKGLDGVWHCFTDRPKMFFDVTDKHLPNAVAKALIEVKKGAR